MKSIRNCLKKKAIKDDILIETMARSCILEVFLDRLFEGLNQNNLSYLRPLNIEFNIMSQMHCFCCFGKESVDFVKNQQKSINSFSENIKSLDKCADVIEIDSIFNKNCNGFFGDSSSNFSFEESIDLIHSVANKFIKKLLSALNVYKNQCDKFSERIPIINVNKNFVVKKINPISSHQIELLIN